MADVAVPGAHAGDDGVAGRRRVAYGQGHLAGGRVGGETRRQVQVDADQRGGDPVLQVALGGGHLLNVGADFRYALFDVHDVLNGGGVFQQRNQAFLLGAPGGHPGFVVNQPVGDVGGGNAFVRYYAQCAEGFHGVVEPFGRHADVDGGAAVAAFAQDVGGFHPAAALGRQRFHLPGQRVNGVHLQADPGFYDELAAGLRVGLRRQG